MNFRKSFIIVPIVYLGFYSFSFAQFSKKELFSLNNEAYYPDEFVYAFSKNNTVQHVSKDSINNYLKLFINFKLKVKAAKAAGYDTTKAFTQEFNLYKKQLDETYLSPIKEQEALVKQAYDRSLWQIKASHILIRLPENPSPSDTLRAFNKINELRNKIVEGQKFSEIAKQFSQDPSARQNGGDLGYFSVFQMVYPFENTAYTTPKGEVSNPFRTRFGYHILKVYDKRPNQGSVKVAHIMIRSTAKNSDQSQNIAKQKADSIYTLLQKGYNWDSLCQHFTEDLNSKSKNGELPPFGAGQIVPAFEQAAFALSNPGDITAPVKTPYGWHIIKLLEKIPVKSFEEQKNYLIKKIQSDSRSSVPKAEMLASLKKKYKVILNKSTVAQIEQIPASSIVKNKWQFDSTQRYNTNTLFTINSQPITQHQFLNSLQGHRVATGATPKIALSKALDRFQDSLVLTYATQQLPVENPDYKFLIEEYYNGILLFSIMEDSVWNKAIQDSVGLQKYYQKHAAHYTITLKDTLVFSANSEKYADSIVHVLGNVTLSGKQLFENGLEKNQFDTLHLQPIPKKDNLWEEIVTKAFHSNKKIVPYNSLWYIVWEVQFKEQATLGLVKGRVISDYQSYLDTQWITELRKRYHVKINKKQLKNVYVFYNTST